MNAFCWQLMVRAEPNRVFGSLVRAASTQGRVCGVENYGRTITFTASRRRPDRLGEMRATVHACEQGSLVSIEPAWGGSDSPDAIGAQAEAVAALMHSLARPYREAQALAAVS